MKPAKVVLAALLVLVIVTVPSLSACGEGESAQAHSVTLGFMSDFTGRAAFALNQVYKGTQDYLQMVEDEDVIPDLEIELVTYDTRGDYGRAPAGYQWLRGQGSQLIFMPSAQDQETLASRLEADQIPAIGGQGSQLLLDQRWAFSLYPATGALGRLLLEWIMNQWDYEGEGRLPRVAHAGYASYLTTADYKNWIDDYLEANPDKFDWKGHHAPPMGTTTWSLESQKLRDCDYVIVSIVGPGTGSFIKEMRQRGYDGDFLSGIDAFPGFWDLIREVNTPDSLYGCSVIHFLPWWNDGGSFVQEAKDRLAKYRTEAEAGPLLRSSNYFSGSGMALLAVDAIRRAVDQVGVDNISAEAIQDALVNTNLVVEGWGNPWEFQDTNACARTARMYDWDLQLEDWVGTGEWYDVPLRIE